VKLKYISTDDQVVDILTKPFSKIKFAYLRDKMGPVEITHLAEREEMAPWVGRDHFYVIYLWKVIFQFGKWFKLGSSFPVRKVVQDF
jgi:hypothetical protein